MLVVVRDSHERGVQARLCIEAREILFRKLKVLIFRGDVGME